MGPVLLNNFSNEVIESIKSTLCEFANDTYWDGSVDLLKDRKVLQRDVDRLDQWDEIICLTFSKAKC